MSTSPNINIPTPNLPAGVRSVIAVASGKGGVGKSTTTVNLAVALKQLGLRVGILDADVYGPNIPMMMGIKEDERPDVDDQQRLIPFESHGIPVVSIGFLVDAGKPVIWRGPMLHGILRQFLTQVVWNNLDVLLVDLPPGTGDAPLSLVQMAPLTGAVVVTTPQAVAQSDVRRSIAMFQEVNVPVLGLVENMGSFECSHCHHTTPLFEGQGGSKLSEEYHVPLLGQVPFDPIVGRAGDQGAPVVMSKPESAQAQAFVRIAEQILETVRQMPQAAAPRIEIA